LGVRPEQLAWIPEFLEQRNVLRSEIDRQFEPGSGVCAVEGAAGVVVVEVVDDEGGIGGGDDAREVLPREVDVWVLGEGAEGRAVAGYDPVDCVV